MAANRGSKHHGSRLTEARVRAARKSYENREGGWILRDGKRVPVTATSLARKYGVSRQTMYAALTRMTWKHVS